MNAARETTPRAAKPDGDGKYRGTADFHEDGATIRRSVTVRRPREEVERAWAAAGIPGEVTFTQAAGDRGVEVRVEAPAEAQNALKELLGAFMSDDSGDSLSVALRQFKSTLETGEAPTTIGQPSGREAIAE